MKHLFVTLVILISLSVITKSQTQTQVLNDAIKNIEKVEKRIKGDKIQFEQVLKEGQVLADLENTKEAIIDLKKLARNQTLPQDFLQNIQASVETLTELTNQPTPPTPTTPTGITSLTIEETQLAQDLLQDVQAKTETGCESNGVRFSITVRTRNGTEEINNQFEVRYTGVIEPSSDGNRFAGGALVSANDNVEAGVYYFWSLDPVNSSRKGKKERHTITCLTASTPIFLQIP